MPVCSTTAAPVNTIVFTRLRWKHGVAEDGARVVLEADEARWLEALGLHAR